MRRINLLALSVVVACAALVPTLASAGSISSHLTIATHNEAGPGGYLDGKLTSTKASCVKGETVKLKWDAPGAPTSYAVVATDTTNKSGKWRIDGPSGTVPSGKYFAKVAQDGACPAVKTSKITVA